MFSKESKTLQSRRWHLAETIVDSRFQTKFKIGAWGVEHQKLSSAFNVKAFGGHSYDEGQPWVDATYVNCPGLQVPGSGREIRETLPVQVEKKEVDDDTKDQEEEDDEPKYLENNFDSTK